MLFRSCALTCQNGGVLDSECTVCTCPLGLIGRHCEAGYSAAPLAACAGVAGPVVATYSFGAAGVLPPTQASFLALYPAGETSAFGFAGPGLAYLCGDTYDATVNGGLCPASGTVSVPAPSVPGRYKLAVAAWSPANVFGVSGCVALPSVPALPARAICRRLLPTGIRVMTLRVGLGGLMRPDRDLRLAADGSEPDLTNDNESPYCLAGTIRSKTATPSASSPCYRPPACPAAWQPPSPPTAPPASSPVSLPRWPPDRRP